MIKCPQCSKSFSHRENLIRHSKNHMAVKSHTCRVCDKGFFRSDLLAKHEMSHNKTNPTPSTKRQITRSSRLESSKRRKTICDKLNNVPIAQGSGARTSDINLSPTSQGIDGTQTQVFDSCGIHDTSENAMQTAASLHLLSHSTASWDTEEATFPYFDFLSFSRPWNPEIPTDSSEWFSVDFYEALDETNAGIVGVCESEPFQSAFFPFEINVFTTSSNDLHSSTSPSANITTEFESRSAIPEPLQGTACTALSTAQISYEDRVQTRENQTYDQSHPLSEPISLEKSDPLVLGHDSTFDISESVYREIEDFLGINRPKDCVRYFTLPSLKIVNIFIGLFFRVFYPQSPVLHLPTTRTNNLPRPLITIIIVIGAIHSKLRRAQKFAMSALDCVRQKLQLMVETNSTLLGDLNIIYASVLICYTGLWCGNKRSFDLADIMRSAAVTYIRRLPRHHGLNDSQTKVNLKSQWSDWISHENQKRLLWFVYMVDNQFPSLHNMPAMMSVAEVMKWELPCDEEFWAASTECRWKCILGSAPLPPGPIFAVAVAPFLWPREGDFGWSSHGIRLNPWSSYLLLTILSLKTFEYCQHLSTLNQICLYDSNESDERDMPIPVMQADSMVCSRKTLLRGLHLWEQTFQTSPAVEDPFHQVNTIFNISSHFLLRICFLYLNIPLMDLQEAIGKNGPENARKAFSRLKMWFPVKYLQLEDDQVDGISTRLNDSQRSDSFAMNASSEAIKLIKLVLRTQSQSSNMPLSIISLFLSHVALWAIAKTASSEIKALIPELVNPNSLDQASWVQLRKVLDLAMIPSESGDASEAGLILKQCAATLTKLGYWGASLNLAFLLQQLAEAS